MKRRIRTPKHNVLLLPLMLGLLTGCIHKHEPIDPTSGPPQGVRIAVMVHGPFATMVHENGLRELMPRSKDGAHELVFPYPGAQDVPLQDNLQKDGCKITVAFELEGVESAEKIAIDPAFDPVRFSFPDRKHDDDDDFFVTMKLPLPRRINGVGLYPVRFDPKNPGPIEYVPRTQVLEFMASDMGKVEFVRTETKKCKGSSPSRRVDNLRPITCRDLRQKYEDYFRSTPDSESAEESERPFLRDELRRCRDDAGFFFVGVGLDPNNNHDRFAEHAQKFFNEQLLPLIFGERPIPERRKLTLALGPARRIGQTTDSPMLRPAVYMGHAPRLVLVAANANCLGSSVINIDPNTLLNPASNSTSTSH